MVLFLTYNIAISISAHFPEHNTTLSFHQLFCINVVGKKIGWTFWIFVRHNGHSSNRDAQFWQQVMWPHGQKAVDISQSIHTLHRNDSWIFSNLAFNTWKRNIYILNWYKLFLDLIQIPIFYTYFGFISPEVATNHYGITQV